MLVSTRSAGSCASRRRAPAQAGRRTTRARRRYCRTSREDRRGGRARARPRSRHRRSRRRRPRARGSGAGHRPSLRWVAEGNRARAVWHDAVVRTVAGDYRVGSAPVPVDRRRPRRPGGRGARRRGRARSTGALPRAASAGTTGSIRRIAPGSSQYTLRDLLDPARRRRGIGIPLGVRGGPAPQSPLDFLYVQARHGRQQTAAPACQAADVSIRSAPCKSCSRASGARPTAGASRGGWSSRCSRRPRRPTGPTSRACTSSRARSRTGTAIRAGSSCCCSRAAGASACADGEHELTPGDYLVTRARGRDATSTAPSAGADCVWLDDHLGRDGVGGPARRSRRDRRRGRDRRRRRLRRAARRARSRRAGRSVLVLEARDRPGGRTWTRPFAGSGPLVEIGGSWFTPEHARGAAELARYGLASRTYGAPAAVRWRTGGELRDGLPVPFDELGALDAALAAIAAMRRRCAPGRSAAAARSRAPTTCGSWARRARRASSSRPGG